MDDQKIENQLNLALDATEEERRKSEVLDVGFNPIDRTWELIVRYHGDAAEIVERMGGQLLFEELFGGYAIVTIEERLINDFAALEQIEYIEKPKRLFFSINQGKAASCITEVQVAAPFLSGIGVLVGIVDSGISYKNMDFRNEDGTTRIMWLWDQTQENGVYSEAQINEALLSNETISVDITGHGTAVAGIAAGNGNNSEGRYRGVAYRSKLIVVKLGNPSVDAFPHTTQLMRGVDFCIRRAVEASIPIAINISFGNTYGSHQGDSLVETFLNNASGIWKNVICVGSGNEGAAGGHAGGTLTGQVQVRELAIDSVEDTISIQLWKRYHDTFTVELVSPNGSRVVIPSDRQGTWRYLVEQTELLVYLGEPTPYSILQEIYIEMLPHTSLGLPSEAEQGFINSGIWRFELTPRHIVDGRYNFYLPSDAVLSPETRFLLSTPNQTLTIPSVAAGVITVAAYDSLYSSYAAFSGRGFQGGLLQHTGAYKPTIAAPGVGIVTTTTTNSYASFTGTSFATPFVTGSAALMMEWGIVRGNDPYLYSEKIKAYLIKGARQLPGITETPNPLTGWGALCLADSIPD
ncbi:MAG: S8 family peptidase [Lachnospiraceae bacterium]